MKFARDVDWATVVVSVLLSTTLWILGNFSTAMENLGLMKEMVYGTKEWNGEFENFEGVVDSEDLKDEGFDFCSGEIIGISANEEAEISGYVERNGVILLLDGAIKFGGNESEGILYDVVGGRKRNVCNVVISIKEDHIELQAESPCDHLSGKFLRKPNR